MVAPCETAGAGAAFAAGEAGDVPSGLATVAPCEAAESTLAEAGVPSGFATVAPCAAGAVDGGALAAPLCGSPRGFETVAPCDTGAVTPAEACVPSGLATVAPCAAGTAGFVALSLVVAGVVCPTGFAAVAAGGAEAGAATVADNTLAVMFGEPAELGVEIAGPVAGAGATVALACVEVLACSPAEGVGGAAAAGALAVVEAAACAAGATVTLTDDGTLLPCGAFDVGRVFTANSGLVFGVLGVTAVIEV